MELRIRFAPTPSGYLHVGNAFNAILIKVWAVQHNAKLLLRIDDLDHLRSRIEFVEDIFETLHWLNIDWDEGPSNITEFYKHWSQPLRLARYQQILDYLQNEHRLYACQCSRSSFKTTTSAVCACHTTSHVNSPHTLRLIPTPKTFELQDEWNNRHELKLDKVSSLTILQKMDRLPSYQLTSLIDDLDFRVSHVIRGQDLLESSAFQSLLFTHLPPISQLPKWMHHELILKQNKKISKSNGDISIHHLRSQGETAQRIYSWVGNMLGYRSIHSLADLTSVLDLTQKPLMGFNYWV